MSDERRPARRGGFRGFAGRLRRSRLLWFAVALLAAGFVPVVYVPEGSCCLALWAYFCLMVAAPALVIALAAAWKGDEL